MELLQKRLGIPLADEIYAPDETRLAARPRLTFGDANLATFRRRAADPRYSAIVAQIHASAADTVALTPPDTVVMDAHDPNRVYADSLAWMAASILIDPQPGRRVRTMDGLLRWVRALRAWGPFTTNLSLAQSTIGLCLVYDWLHAELPPDERDAIRAQIIAQARLSLDETRGGLTMWRGQRFAANHNWAHHSARAYAAFALWGDTDAPLAPGELKFWLDDALVDFWIVRHTHTTDGAPLEGGSYQDYGLRFYLDFIAQAEHLLRVRESFYDEHLRALHARLHTLLPGNRGGVVYADGFENNWGASCAFNARRLASHYRDARFQLLADQLQTATGNTMPSLSWRDLFAYDADLAPARLEDMPRWCDMADFGLFTARRDWSGDAPFFALRCGTASGESVVRTLGHDFGEAHAYTNQGDIAFYHGAHAILPGCDYAKRKLTSNHNLVLFEGRDAQAGRLVGQLGEGGAWFNTHSLVDPDADYELRDGPARVLSVIHAATHHRYLCDLGGLYRLRDERVPGGVFFAEYLRSVVFLSEGAVAIVDRLRTPVPRTCVFRLLTATAGLAADAHGFSFQVGAMGGRIEDFSPAPLERAVEVAPLASQTSTPRAIASLRAENTGEAIFAVVLAIGPAVGRYRLEADEAGHVLIDTVGGERIRMDRSG